MWIGIVVVLWPYMREVMGLNLGGHKVGFIFANSSLEWSWKGKGKPNRGNQERLKNPYVINIE